MAMRRWAALFAAGFVLSGGATSNETARVALTPEHIDVFCRRLEAEMAMANAAFFDAALDEDALLDKALSGQSVTSMDVAQVKAGARKQWATSSLGKQIAATVRTGSTYRYLGLRKIDGLTVALFRAEGGDAALNYHGLRLAAGSPTLRIVDLHVMNTGRWLSETYRELLQPLSRGAGQRMVDAVDGRRKAEVAAGYHQLRNLSANTQAGDYAGALAIWKSLPVDLREQKNVLLMGLACAQQFDEKEWLPIADRFEACFPGDPCLDLVLLGALAARGRYEHVLTRVDRLDRTIGGDPYLNVYRAVSLYELGRQKEAHAAIDKALEALPDSDAAHACRLSFAVRERRFDQVVEHLERMERERGTEVDHAALAADASYAEFVKSPAYAAWRARAAAEKKIE